MEQDQQEIIFKLSMFEQQMQQLQEQLQAVEERIIDLNSLNIGLDELKESCGKEILAPVGRGMFVKAKLISEDLIVNIGGKNLVKKNIPDAQRMIEEQIQKLEDMKKEMNEMLEKTGEEITKTIRETGETGKEKQ